jgi:hypothetical protein
MMTSESTYDNILEYIQKRYGGNITKKEAKSYLEKLQEYFKLII